MSDILIGGIERIYLTFTDIDGTRVDPAGDIVVTVTQPDETHVDYSGNDVVNDPSEVGLFYIEHPITQVGIHVAKGVSESPSSAAILQFVSIG